MMNFLALGLVLTSLVTAGFFSPSPENPRSREDVIVKEGHRVVVVEYEKDDGNTKVLISPQDSQKINNGKGFVENAKEKMEGLKEGVEGASSSVLDGVKKKVGNQEEEEREHKFRPRELVCDAYGKCKHKIASVFERTKEAAAEAEEAVSEAAEKVKDTVAHTASKASDRVQEAKENVKDSASEAKEKVSEKASGIRDEAGKKLEGAKDAVSDKAREAAKEAEGGARRARKQAHKELRVILHHARDLAGDVIDYVAPPEKVSPVAGIIHLMGFSAAYGMCLWITFASSYVLAEALPRQQFAMVQSKIYPVYFKAMGYSVGMALLGHLVGPSRRFSPASTAAFQGLNLASSLAMILMNLLWLEPRATKVSCVLICLSFLDLEAMMCVLCVCFDQLIVRNGHCR